MTKRKIYNAVDRPEIWKKVLSGKKVGLITNPSGVDRDLRLTSDILYESGLLTCLFSPEHGVRGDKQAGDRVDSYTDEKTSLPVYSLYGGDGHRIKPEIMEALDALVFDIQDVGAPWIDADEVTEYMRALGFSGVRFRPCHFTPTFSKYSGELCHGISLHLTDPRTYKPFEVGLTLLAHIRDTYREFSVNKPHAGGKYALDLILGCSDFREDGFNVESFLGKQRERVWEYGEKIKKYYLYK